MTIDLLLVEQGKIIFYQKHEQTLLYKGLEPCVEVYRLSHQRAPKTRVVIEPVNTGYPVGEKLSHMPETKPCLSYLNDLSSHLASRLRWMRDLSLRQRDCIIFENVCIGSMQQDLLSSDTSIILSGLTQEIRCAWAKSLSNSLLPSSRPCYDTAMRLSLTLDLFTYA